MSFMLRFSILVLAMGSVLAETTAGLAQQRVVTERIVTSDARPRVRVEVKAPFRYLGRVPFAIRDVARGERIVFGDVTENTVHRLLVLQFESFLPTATGTYRYDFSNARAIGPLRWRSNAFAYSVATAHAENTGSEATTMHTWLAAQGLSLPDTQLMFRYLTLGDDSRRDELIVFYLEGSADGSWLREMAASTERWRSFAVELEARSRTSFDILDPP